jgi:hypothetical protein
VHTHDGITWFDRDGYRELARGVAVMTLLDPTRRTGAARVRELQRALTAAEERSGYRVGRLLGTTP